MHSVVSVPDLNPEIGSVLATIYLSVMSTVLQPSANQVRAEVGRALERLRSSMDPRALYRERPFTLVSPIGNLGSLP